MRDFFVRMKDLSLIIKFGLLAARDQGGEIRSNYDGQNIKKTDFSFSDSKTMIQTTKHIPSNKVLTATFHKF